MPLEVSKIKKNLKKVISEGRDIEDVLNMTANENVTSKTAKYFLSTNFSDRYFAGEYYENTLEDKKCCYLVGLVMRNFPGVCQLEKKARFAMKKMFKANYCDFKPLSGLNAVFCILSAVSDPGDNIYILTPQSVGHHATVPLLNSINRKISFIPWDSKNFTVDLDKFKKEVKKNKPDLIFLDYGTPLYPLPVKEIRSIVGRRTLIIYDASHVLGLIAGGFFQDPIGEGCDILIGNTHKTFPGPQKAVLMYKNKKLGEEIYNKLFEYAISSQHLHQAISLFVSVIEMYHHGKNYADQLIKNSHALSEALEGEGFSLIQKDNQYSQSHIIAVSGPFPDDHNKACIRLHKCGISTNSRKMFGIQALRIGVQEATRKGMKEKEMVKIASFFKKIVLEKVCDQFMRSKVKRFNRRFKKTEYTMDDEFNIVK